FHRLMKCSQGNVFLTNIIPYGIPPAGGSPINVSKPYPPATGSGFYISSRIRVGIQLTIKCIGFAWLLEEVSCYLLLYQSLRIRVKQKTIFWF
ncbi:MAG: hypothetical protein AAGI25_09060, partial [Bacteroidota bacterium]